MEVNEPQKVLSVQSHVVHGYVGNRCAVFPLQLLGFEVDFINTVQFSNHTGYPSFTGNKLGREDLESLIQGLDANSLTTYSLLLTGYIGSVPFLESITKMLQLLRERNPNIKYLCDPVLGDNGKLYVPEEMVPLYRELIKHADTITPNQFEAQQLSGRTINTLSDAVAICNAFHEQGIPRVVITSLTLADNPGQLLVLGSERGKQQFTLSVPQLHRQFTGTGGLCSASLSPDPHGHHFHTCSRATTTYYHSAREELKGGFPPYATGDLLSALILGWGAIEDSFSTSVEKAVAGVQGAISHTAVIADQREKEGKPVNAAHLELQLVAARNVIMNPDIRHRATPIQPK